MKLDADILNLLACPRCRGRLNVLTCEKCSTQFPDVDGIPVLINEENSIFRIDDVLRNNDTTYRKSSAAKRLLKSILPSISINVKAKENYKAFFERLGKEATQPKVLVIGGAVAGSGLDDLPPNVTLVNADVAIGPQTSLVCDGHDLPFLDGAFDGVVAQAVLEHVLVPAECVAEIHRVLRPGGLVYAETPFMQQVHAGRYDFTRFSHLGHRYLFRQFDEIASGACAGPATAFVWSYCYFLQSFFRSKTLGQMAFTFGTLTGFWLKYLDYFLVNRPNSFDAASAYFFLGAKSENSIGGDELIAGYKGMIY